MIYRSLAFIFFVLSGHALADPNALRKDLQGLDDRLQSISAGRSTDVPGVQNLSAETLIQKSEQSFRIGEYLACVRFLNLLLNKSPALESARYLKAQYLLGRSYEELRYPARAIKAYLRYMGSYATRSKDSVQRLTEVSRRLLLLRESMLSEESEAFQRLLANLMGLGFPDEVQAQITLLAGISAYHSGNYKLAESWLGSIAKYTDDSKVKAEGRYYESLVQLAMGKLDASEKLLTELAESSDGDLQFIRQIARLNLARLFAERKMHQHAWTWYQKVEGPGNSQRLALYESALLLMRMDDFSKAAQLAKTYIKSYPDSKEAAFLKERLGYVQLSMGALDEAESHVNLRQSQLHDLAQNLKGVAKTKLQAEDVANLRNDIAPFGINSAILDRSHQLFQRLEEARFRLQEHRQELRSLNFTLGRVSDPDLRPDLLSANRQFMSLIQDMARIGNGLLEAEKNVYDLNETETMNLERSAARRDKIMNSTKQSNPSWKTAQALAQLEQDSARLSERISKQRAQLTAWAFLGDRASASPTQKDKANHVRDIMRVLASTNEKLSLMIESQRLGWLQSYRQHSIFQKTRKTFLLLTQEMLDSVSLLETHRDSFKSPERKHYQEDFAADWVIWPRTAGKLLSAIRKRDADERDWLMLKRQAIQKARSDEQALGMRHSFLADSLAKVSGKALPSVLNHVSYQIHEQSARSKKWLADIKWQQYLQDTENRLAKEKNHALEEARLKEALRDAEIERALHD